MGADESKPAPRWRTCRIAPRSSVPEQPIVFLVGEDLEHDDRRLPAFDMDHGVDAPKRSGKFEPPRVLDLACKAVAGAKPGGDPVLGDLVSREDVDLQAVDPPREFPPLLRIERGLC